MKAYNMTANADLNTAVVGVYVAAGLCGWHKPGRRHAIRNISATLEMTGVVQR